MPLLTWTQLWERQARPGAKSLHEKAGASHDGFCFFLNGSLALSRLCRHPSIRTLVERFFARCQLGVLISAMDAQKLSYPLHGG